MKRRRSIICRCCREIETRGQYTQSGNDRADHVESKKAGEDFSSCFVHGPEQSAAVKNVRDRALAESVSVFVSNPDAVLTT